MRKLTRTMQDDFIITNKQEVASLISSLSEEVALFIACQFALESNYGKSNLAVRHNNITGMRRPVVRPSTCKPDIDSYGFACYDCRFNCIIDYFLCISYHRPLGCELERVNRYAGFIKKFYCLENGYIEKIMSIYDKYSYLLTKN